MNNKIIFFFYNVRYVILRNFSNASHIIAVCSMTKYIKLFCKFNYKFLKTAT